MSKKRECLTCGSLFTRLVRHTRHYTECYDCESLRLETEEKIYPTIKKNIVAIYQKYKTEHEPFLLRKRRILNTNEFIVLYNYLNNNIDAHIWSCVLLGVYKHTSYPKQLTGVPVMLNPEQTTKLIMLCVDDDGYLNDFAFVLGPHVLLAAEVKDQTFGNYHPCGTLDEIKTTWSNLEWLYNIKGVIVLGKCGLCIKNVLGNPKGYSGLSRGHYCYCRACENIYHTGCKFSNMIKSSLRCQCGLTYEKMDDLVWDKNIIFKIDNSYHTFADWRDYYKFLKQRA